MSEVIYVGKGKRSKFGYRFSVCLSDIPAEHINEFNGKKYINLELKEMRQPDKFGKTHTVTVDTWKPEAKLEQSNEPMPESIGTNDLPF